MLQIRKLALAVAAATSMASGMAHALGLGEVSVKSALNEPLVAEIELLDTKGLSSDEIRSKLASVEDFSRAGVDRQFFLNNLKFTPVVRQNGKSFVRVTSSHAVREPFLNFLLEVYWPAGRLLKEYTLLLDPPMYTPQELVYRSAPGTTQASTNVQPWRTATASQAPRAATRSALQGDQYRVRANDTLWEIALRARRGGSVHQAMLALQDLNLDAFIDGNINKLKAGQVLKLPDAEQVRQRSRSQAIAEFEQRVKTGRSDAPVARQLDARQRETATAAPVRAEQGDSLRLVAGEKGESESGSESGATDGALADQLALTKEQLNSTRLQNKDLVGQVEGLSSQIERLQRLLELKNIQLASLQYLSDKEQAAFKVKNTGAGKGVAEIVETEVVDFEVKPVDAVKDVTEVGLVTEKQVTRAVLDVRAKEAAVAASDEIVPPIKPTSVVFKSLFEPRNFIEKQMGNHIFLPITGGSVALLLLLLRRKQQVERRRNGLLLKEFDEQLYPRDDPRPDIGSVDVLGDTKKDPAVFVNRMSTSRLETDNPIVEAESLIVVGRFSQAANVLLKAVDADPQRKDLRFKLLEIYADIEDRNSFKQQVEELNAMGASQDEIDVIRQRFSHILSENEDDLNFGELLLDTLSVSAINEVEVALELGEMLVEDISALGGLLGEVTFIDVDIEGELASLF